MAEQLLVQYSASVLSIILAFSLLAAWQTGLWVGKRLKLRRPKARWSKFDDASLALLGLLIAFTFGMSISRHDDRRLMVIHDSNAIGDFYTCASLLGEPVRSRLQSVIRDYTSLRVAVARGSGANPFLMNQSLDQFEHLQNQMTGLVGEALRAGTPIAVPLTTTLNNLISIHAERVGAVENRLPVSIIFLLFFSALAATMLVGREQGFEDRREIAATLCFILLVTFAIYVTLDLNQPARGLVTVSQAPIERLLAAMTAPK